jgi:hypothetical protein
VNAAIAKLNYVPNRAARSLASRTSGAIALIVPEDTAFFFGDPYFAAIVQGITRRLDDSDYLLNLLVASTDPGHKTVRYLRSGVVDGALVISHTRGTSCSTRPACCSRSSTAAVRRSCGRPHLRRCRQRGGRCDRHAAPDRRGARTASAR